MMRHSMEISPLLGGRLFPGPEHLGFVVGMNGPPPGIAQGLGHGPPGYDLPRGVDVGQQVFGIGVEDADGRGLADFPEPFFPPAKLVFLGFAGGVVDGQSLILHHLSGAVQDRGFVNVQPDILTHFTFDFDTVGFDMLAAVLGQLRP